MLCAPRTISSVACKHYGFAPIGDMLHITSAQYLSDHKVSLRFNNGRQGEADLSVLLNNVIFTSLQDKSLFSQVSVDSAVETVVWLNGLDLAPECLYFHAFREDPLLHHS